MEEIKIIKKHYEMGFISSHEFLCEYAGVLIKLGAYDNTYFSRKSSIKREQAICSRWRNKYGIIKEV